MTDHCADVSRGIPDGDPPAIQLCASAAASAICVALLSTCALKSITALPAASTFERCRVDDQVVGSERRVVRLDRRLKLKIGCRPISDVADSFMVPASNSNIFMPQSL